MKTVFQEIGEETASTFNRYWNAIEGDLPELWHYCCKITGSPWDAEDLVQDTILKTFATLSAWSHRQQAIEPKFFLFKVASNHWIDICRKNQRLSTTSEEEIVAPSDVDSLEMREAIMTMVHILTPKQAVVFTLIEGFQYSGHEVASLLDMTENAIHQSLHRARKKLQDTVNNPGKLPSKNKVMVKDSVLNQYVKAFNSRNMDGIIQLLDDHVTQDWVIRGEGEYGKETLKKYSIHTEAEIFKDTGNEAFLQPILLWGKPALALCTDKGNGTELIDIRRVIVDSEKIIRFMTYYHCRTFLDEAAFELGWHLIPLDQQFVCS